MERGLRTRAFNIAPIMRRSEPLFNGAGCVLLLHPGAVKQWRIISVMLLARSKPLGGWGDWWLTKFVFETWLTSRVTTSNTSVFLLVLTTTKQDAECARVNNDPF